MKKVKIINKKFAKGFTLIELLICILIIGVLAGIALQKYRQIIDKSNFMCIMSVLKTLTNAQQVAALSRGSYPAYPNYFKFGDLDVDIPGIPSSCMNSSGCLFNCGKLEFNIILRNQETWGNFYFWANSIERISYSSTGKYRLECVSTRCEKLAKQFGAKGKGPYSW